MPLTPEQEALKAAALAATPGPWHHDSDPVKGDPLGRVRFRVTAPGRTIVQTYYSNNAGGTSGEPDNRFIAAANPAAILALLAQLEAMP